jgi:hypothetical protein
VLWKSGSSKACPELAERVQGMKDAVLRLNAEYGLSLTEAEIEAIRSASGFERNLSYLLGESNFS